MSIKFDNICTYSAFLTANRNKFSYLTVNITNVVLKFNPIISQLQIERIY